MLKIKHPTFSINMPSDGSKITFRPFTVKEEKILLVASQENTPDAVLDSIKQILNNCVVSQDFKVDNIPMFDLEFLFLHLRARSVNNVIELTVTDPEDKFPYKVELDVNDVKVYKDPEHSRNIMLNDTMGLMMKYPTIAMAKSIDTESLPQNILFDIMASCIDKVFDGEEVQVAGTDFTKQDALEFIEDLTTDNFAKVQKFFDTIPILKHDIKYKNKAGEEKTVKLVGLQDFFQ